MASSLLIIIVLIPAVYLLLIYVVMSVIARYVNVLLANVIGWLIISVPIYFILAELSLCNKPYGCNSPGVFLLYLVAYFTMPCMVAIGMLMTWRIWHKGKKPKLSE